MKESKLYPIVEKWLAKEHRCFKTGKNTGLRYSRADVVGVRDVGGELAGEVETIIIEVKKGTEAFATASGQAFGYTVYANKVYLADIRETGFTPEEIRIASHLRIGLLQIKNNKVKEILSSPYHGPILKMNLLLLEKLGLGKCSICGTFFQTGEKPGQYTRLVRGDLERAISKQKGIVFWNEEVSDRKYQLGVDDREYNYERRFICADCVALLGSGKR